MSRLAGGAVLLALLGLVPAPVLGQARDLADLSLEELANIEVTSVTGKSARLWSVAASIYVITGVSGVQWDQQDVMLADVERIEVISGPGSTIWGANAVNGVINVITRAAKDTQGTAAEFAAGNQETSGAARPGGTLGEHGHFRLYAKTQQLQNTRTAAGARDRSVLLRAKWTP